MVQDNTIDMLLSLIVLSTELKNNLHAGECWSGENSEKTYNKDGASHQCITKGYKDCPANGKHCVGHAVNNYVYTVTSE